MITGSYYCGGFPMDFLYIIHHTFWIHVHVPIIDLFIYSVWTLNPFSIPKSQASFFSIIEDTLEAWSISWKSYILEHSISRIPNETEDASSTTLVGYILSYTLHLYGWALHLKLQEHRFKRNSYFHIKISLKAFVKVYLDYFPEILKALVNYISCICFGGCKLWVQKEERAKIALQLHAL